MKNSVDGLLDTVFALVGPLNIVDKVRAAAAANDFPNPSSVFFLNQLLYLLIHQHKLLYHHCLNLEISFV